MLTLVECANSDWTLITIATTHAVCSCKCSLMCSIRPSSLQKSGSCMPPNLRMTSCTANAATAPQQLMLPEPAESKERQLRLLMQRIIMQRTKVAPRP
eukprot:6184040-Pleurochrysis_carterae.AAC.7